MEQTFSLSPLWYTNQKCIAASSHSTFPTKKEWCKCVQWYNSYELIKFCQFSIHNNYEVFLWFIFKLILRLKLKKYNVGNLLKVFLSILKSDIQRKKSGNSCEMLNIVVYFNKMPTFYFNSVLEHMPIKLFIVDEDNGQSQIHQFFTSLFSICQV